MAIHGQKARPFSRRQVLASCLAAAGTSCSLRREADDGRVHLTFYTWGEAVELEAFRTVIGAFERLRSDVRVQLEEISYKTRSEIDTLIAAGIGPDLFRIPYLEIGRYSVSGAIVDLSPYLPPNLGSQFTEATWTAVQSGGKAHALPHHTDTSAILYNKTIFDRLGIKAPCSLEKAWTWDEFVAIASKVKRSACEFGFAMNWTYGGAFRWLNFLYQHGGTFLDASGRQTRLLSDALAEETVAWTQSFFSQGLIPPGDSAKSSQQVENLFATGVVGMYFDVGPQSLQQLNPAFPWGATFLPRDRQAASELGGNAIAVSRDCKHPELAAEFAAFVTNEENMRRFVIAAQFLPVRRSLLEETLIYPYRPDEMKVHLEQSKTVPLALARTTTGPGFYQVNRILGDELDAAFTGGQKADKTVQRIAHDVDRVLSEQA